MKKITFLFTALLMSALSWQGTAQSGSTCDDPLVVSAMPFNDSGNTSTYGDNYTSSDIPPVASNAVTDGSSHTYYLNGDEAVYSYTAGANGSITIDVTGVVGYTGIFAFTGCPFSSTVGYHVNSSAGSRSIPDLPVMAGETYFIVISTWATPQSTDYTINITGPDVADPPTCPKPTSLTASNFTVNSADVSWTEEGTASNYEIEYGENGFTLGDGTIVTGISSTSYSITGLDASAPYSVYVRAICGPGDESFWSGPLNFRTLCDAISTLPNTEDFDTYGTGSDAFPPCWGRPVTYTSGSNTWPAIVARSGTSSTPNALKFQSAVDTPTYAVSPPFAEDIDNLRVSFMLKREGESSGTIDVGVMSDATDINTFELVETIDPDNNDFNEYVFDLNQVTLSGSGNFIALRHNSNSSIYYYWVDDFTVGLVPTCLEPSNLTASNLTVNSADVSWTEEGTASSWDIEYGENGFARGDGTMVTDLTSASYSITGLDASTAYNLYVRADCGAGDESFWTGPMSFRTLCDAISTLPSMEDFDTYGTGSDAFPACWERPVTYTSGTTTWPSIVSRSGTSSAPNALKFQSLVDTPTYAVSPPFTEDIDNLRVSFMLKREGASSGTIDVGVMSDASDINTFELVETIDPDNNDFIEYVFDLNQVTLSGSGNFIALRHNSDSSVYYYWVDDFHVGLVPTCPEPTGLTVDNTTFNSSAEISWTAGDAETSWNISWGPSGYTPGDSNEIGTDTASVTNYEITGLGVDIYDVYVQANCGIGDLSYWTSSVTFTTGYCIPTGSSNNGDEIRNFTLSNLDNDSAASEGTNGFSNYSSTVDPAELEAGETYVASLTSGTGSGNHGAAIWIDYDQNGVFDSSEMVAFVSNVTASTTVDFPEFTVPASTADGTYRLRVQYHYNKTGDVLDPCLTTSGYSETEDYNVTVGGGAGGTFPAPYCDVTAESVEEITKVDFDGTIITNTDTTTVLIDKTDTVVDVMQDEIYTLKVEGNTHDTPTAEFDSNIVAFIDWNQNGILDDAGEVYELGTLSGSTGNDGVFVSMDITVPADAVLGETRIRITKTYFDEDSPAEVNPCDIEFDAFGYMIVPGFGQALDFTLNVEEDQDSGYSCEFAHEVVGDANGGGGSSVDSDFKSAVDVIVPAGTDFTLDTILVPFLTYAPEDAPITAQVVYYENAGGLPGSEIGSETVVPTILSSGEWVNPVAYEFKTQLDMTPFTFDGDHGMDTTYWIEISMGTATNQATVFWEYTEGAGLVGAPMVQYNADDGAWSVPEVTREGIYNFSGECALMEPLGDCSGTPDGGIVSVNPETGNIDISYIVSATGFSSGYTGLTYQWQSNTDGDGWEDEGDLEDHYAAFNATAPDEIGIEVEWRLEVTCTISGESAFSDVATFTTVLTYCDAASSSVEPITRVIFAGIDNQSSPTSTEGYEDFTDIVGQVEAGGTYSFAAEGHTGGGFTNYFTVWIDWNNNGEFESDEMYEIGSIQGSDGTDGQQAVNDITVPSNALSGETRMRVRKNFNSYYTDPCGTNTFGQVEDYTIEVGELDDCSGTPDGGVASVNPESGNINSSYTVSATGHSSGNNGLTYQWESNTDGAGWVDEGAIENYYAAFTATAPAIGGIDVQWRLEVTCTFSQETAYSDIAIFTTTSGLVYCTPELDCTGGDLITNVTFQEIDNTTDCSPDGYGDFTDMVATVQSGGTYPISVTVGDGFTHESVSVWIDFDNSGTFEEDEFYYIGTGSDEAVTGEISFPASVAYGDYRMRVRVAAVSEGLATWDMSCDESQGYGETEDYTVTVDGVVGTDDFASTDFTYYPNPMGDVLYITGSKDIESISAYNVLGQEVLISKYFADGKVDVSSLPTGTFMFRVTFESGQIENFKVLKK